MQYITFLYRLTSIFNITFFGGYVNKYLFILLLSLISLGLLVSCGGAAKQTAVSQQAFATASIEFNDLDADLGEIQGDLYVRSMPDFPTVDSMIVYWSSDGKTKGQELARVKYSDRKDLFFTLQANTKLIGQYFVVYVQSKGKEFFTGMNLKIEDHVGKIEKTDPSSSSSSPSSVSKKEQITNMDATYMNAGIDPTIVYFDFDEDTLIPSETEKLSKVYSPLMHKENYTLKVEGHADERGSNEYNLALGARRAYYVKRSLVQYGFFTDKIKVVSYGEERPAMQGNTEQAWKLNRRAVILIHKAETKGQDATKKKTK